MAMSALRVLSVLVLALPQLASAQLRLTLDALPLQDSLFQPSVAQPAPLAPAAPRTPRAERILLEGVGGLAGGLAFGVAAGFAGLALACPSGLEPSPSCLRGIGWGALAGVALAAPPGVFLSGRLLHGGGSFLPTLGGGLLGIGAVLLIAPYAPALLPLLVFGLPAVGSVAGYELSASWRAAHDALPVAAPDSTGGTPSMAVIARF